MITRYDVSESYVNSKSFEPGALYCCNDTGNIYLDSVAENKRVAVAKDVVVLAAESDKPLAPIPNKIYCVVSTGRTYLYYNGAWTTINRAQLHFSGITVPTGNNGYTLRDTRITANDTGIFVPDLSMKDLCTSFTVTCSLGSAKIVITADYPIVGEVIIN